MRSVSDNITLEDAIEGFIISRRAEERSPLTIEDYTSILNRFVWWLGKERLPQDPTQITTRDIRHFLLYLQTPRRWTGKSLSAHKPAIESTVNKYYRVLRNFFKWMVNEGFIDKSPMAQIKATKVPKKIKETVPPGDLQKLLDGCGRDFIGQRNKLFILIMVDTGLRLSEVFNLEVNDIDIENERIKVMGKGAKERYVHIGARVQKALWRYMLARKSPLPELWLNEHGEPVKSANAFQLTMRRLKARTGVEFSAHKLRHTFARLLLLGGADAFSLQRMLGHESLTMVKEYLSSLSDEDAAEAHRRASPVDRMRLK